MKTKFNEVASSGFVKAVGAMVVVVALMPVAVFAQQKGTFTDERDGKKYKTVKIGDQTWMAENLNYEAEGGEIVKLQYGTKNVSYEAKWSVCYGEVGSAYKSIYEAEGIGTVCANPVKLSKNDIQANCKKYGRLYNWETAMKSCPAGWHLPTNEEWDYLYSYADNNYKADYGLFKDLSFGKSSTAGKYLKAKNGWNKSGNKSGNGTDKYGFTVFPGGSGYYAGSYSCSDVHGGSIFGGVFIDVGNFSTYWSVTKSNKHDRSAYYRYMNYYNDEAGWGNGDKNGLRSVRCLQDNIVSLYNLEEKDGVYYSKGTKVPYSGEVKEDYMDSAAIGNMKNGKRHGEWKYPSSNETLVKKYEDGKLLEMGNYIDDKKHGEWKYFYSNEGLQRIENYINGIKHGEWKEFHFDGELLSVKTYKDDKEHGEWKEFYANENLRQIGNYIDGVKHGEVKSFYSNGSLKAIATYKEGKLHGEMKGYYANGKLEYESTYIDDKPTEMKIFDVNGNLIQSR